MSTTVLIKTTGSVPGTPPAGEHWENIKAVCLPAGVPGRDHESMLRYSQHVCMNFAGILMDDARGQRVRYRVREGWQPKYGTRYWDGSHDPEHDDHDCLYDLEALGLVRTAGTGLNPIIFMTEAGNALAGKLNAIIQRYQLSQPRIERSDPDALAEQVRKEDERQALNLSLAIEEARRKEANRKKRRELKAKRDKARKLEAERIHFAGSVEVPPDEQHPK